MLPVLFVLVAGVGISEAGTDNVCVCVGDRKDLEREQGRLVFSVAIRS